MNPVLTATIAGTASYLLGAIPFGYLVARGRGVDIRRVGSGNIGATNVFRCVGKPWGILVFVCDLLKGLVSAYLFPRLVTGGTEEPTVGLAILCACLAVAGHNWPVFLRFKGGKGVATSAGVLLALAPAAMGIGLLTWIVAFATLRYVSVASILAGIAVGATAWFLYCSTPPVLPMALSILAALVVLRHKTNIQRLVKGTENRFSFKKRGAEGS